ncbi:MAG TPA: hypothetical protein VHX38_03000 [Pseudonocardiaceae bacterium]|jgi:hypothetical protein|nr:hypothetical protein [Pseudonocardiaceae bacterium]
MASDDLTAAAERALIEQACNHAVMKTTHRGDWIADEQAVARAAIEFYRRNAAPAPTVGREALVEMIGDLSNHNPFPEAEDIADGLLSSYHVTAKQGDDRG